MAKRPNPLDPVWDEQMQQKMPATTHVFDFGLRHRSLCQTSICAILSTRAIFSAQIAHYSVDAVIAASAFRVTFAQRFFSGLPRSLWEDV